MTFFLVGGSASHGNQTAEAAPKLVFWPVFVREKICHVPLRSDETTHAGQPETPAPMTVARFRMHQVSITKTAAPVRRPARNGPELRLPLPSGMFLFSLIGTTWRNFQTLRANSRRVRFATNKVTFTQRSRYGKPGRCTHVNSAENTTPPLPR